MSLVLDGTNGLSDIDGSAATPAIRGTDANTGIFFPAADTIAFAEGGAEVMRIDSSGNVGIGTSSPASKLNVVSSGDRPLIVQSGTDTPFKAVSTVANSYIEIANTTNSFYLGAVGANATFVVNAAERARIDSSGNLLVGKTVDTETVTGVKINGGIGQIVCTANSGVDAAVFYRPTSNGGFGVLLTRSDVGGTNTLVGVGYANGTFGAVSDINKKKNVEDARGYLNDLMQIRVVKYNWKTDEDDTPKELGWIAQEVEQVFPGMVNEMEGSKLLKKEVFLPMLVKALQEQQAIITALTARVEALEGTQP